MLLEHWLEHLEDWKSGFKQHRTWVRAVALAVSLLCALGRRTPTQAIRFQGREMRDWSAVYLFFSRARWSVVKLFEFNVARALKKYPQEIVTVGYDQVDLPKTGVKCAAVTTCRAPNGPKYRVNLRHAQRVLHAALLLPLYRLFPDAPCAARAIPIRFQVLEKLSLKEPKAPKKPPASPASGSPDGAGDPAEPPPEERQAYENARREYETARTRFKDAYELEKHLCVLTWVFVAMCHDVRKMLDKLGYAYLTLVSVADGSFCNQTVWKSFEDSLRHVLLVRVRKNASLCTRYDGPKKNKRYGDKKFTPEQIRKDDSIPYQTTKVFHGGMERQIRFKVLTDILWQKGAGMRALILIVIAPTPYRLTKTGKLYYRQPAYLLCSQTVLSIPTLIQCYFDRWQIEVAHREMKTDLGIGQAQVGNPLSVARLPAFMAAAYGALCLAAVELCHGAPWEEFFGPRAKWQKPASRASCHTLLTLLRQEIAEHPEQLESFGMEITTRTLLATAAG